MLISAAIFQKTSKETTLRRLLPFNFFTVGTQLYVKKNKDEEKEILEKGTEIISINGKKTSELIKEFVEKNKRDGLNPSYPNYAVNLGFTYKYWFWYGDFDSFDLVYLDKGGLEKNSTVSAYVWDKELEKKKAKRKHKEEEIKKDTTKSGPEVKTQTLFMATKRKVFVAPENEQIIVLDMESFSPRKAAIKLRKKLFDKLRDDQIKHLVVDIRNNSGGNFKSSIDLARYFINAPFTLGIQKNKAGFTHKVGGWKLNTVIPLLLKGISNDFRKEKKEGKTVYYITIHPHKENHYNGEVYVLINGGSASASCVFSSTLQGQKIGAFLGG